METDPIKQELLVSARSYFTKFGFSRVSTNEIVASAGRSKKTLYKHFSNKEDLLREVLRDIIEEVEAEIMACLESDRTFEEMALDVLMRIAVHEASLDGVLIADLKEKSPKLYEELSDGRDASLLNLLAAVFKVGLTDGLVRQDVNMEGVFRMYLAGIKNQGDAQQFMTHAEAPSELYRDLARVVLDGLLARS